MKKIKLLISIILLVVFLSISVLGANDSNETKQVSNDSISQSSFSPGSLSLHGEKTDVLLGEDIILKLLAENKVTNPAMTIQVIIEPPSGMNITSPGFVESSSGKYNATYIIQPGNKKNIDIRIRSNKVGDFTVDVNTKYYYGNKKDELNDYTLAMQIKVRDNLKQPISTETKEKLPGFEFLLALSAILILGIILKIQISQEEK